jgi:hypothetical protein
MLLLAPRNLLFLPSLALFTHLSSATCPLRYVTSAVCKTRNHMGFLCPEEAGLWRSRAIESSSCREQPGSGSEHAGPSFSIGVDALGVAGGAESLSTINPFWVDSHGPCVGKLQVDKLKCMNRNAV